MPTDRTRTNISRNNKNRGRNFQQEIRDLILEKFTTLEPDDCKSTSSGAQGEDVQLSPAARKLLPIQIEAKRMKSAKGIYNWVRQASSHGKHEPVVFIRADREQALAIVSATHYLQLLRELSELKGASSN
jgi:hypothetical protein